MSSGVATSSSCFSSDSFSAASSAATCCVSCCCESSASRTTLAFGVKFDGGSSARAGTCPSTCSSGSGGTSGCGAVAAVGLVAAAVAAARAAAMLRDEARFSDARFTKRSLPASTVAGSTGLDTAIGATAAGTVATGATAGAAGAAAGFGAAAAAAARFFGTATAVFVLLVDIRAGSWDWRSCRLVVVTAVPPAVIVCLCALRSVMVGFVLSCSRSFSCRCVCDFSCAS